MAIKTIEYEVNINGIAPATEQFGGTQGDHRVTRLLFNLNDHVRDKIEDAAVAACGKAMYRFDVYDGEGGIWQSESAELDFTVGIELEEKHTRHGGKITVYLVLTALSADNNTEKELYSFPAVLRLKNRPEGTHQDGESYESVTSLAEAAKSNALAAEKSNKELQCIAAEIEEKLKNGEYDGLGIKNAEIINDELIITYTDDTQQNLGNVRGAIGPQGEKGDKGDSGVDGKDAIIDQTYNPQSTNAQSGVAMAGALQSYVPKAEASPIYDLAYVLGPGGYDTTVIIEDVAMNLADADNFGNCIPRRNRSGNLLTRTPLEDLECANKKYVDDLTGDIVSALDKLHNYAQAIIGGAE